MVQVLLLSKIWSKCHTSILPTLVYEAFIEKLIVSSDLWFACSPDLSIEILFAGLLEGFILKHLYILDDLKMNIQNIIKPLPVLLCVGISPKMIT